MVLHIPHASTVVPPSERACLLPGDAELQAEYLRLTDHYTDELFAGAVPGAQAVVFPVSRLVVDPERFEDDAREPASAHGMGVVYTRGSRGQPLRGPLSAAERQRLLAQWYHPHHQRLADAVDGCLERSDRCLLIDCHSFPRQPLPIERSGARPDICIGTDPLHTPGWLRDEAVACFASQGWSVAVDEPFAGALVPARHHGRDHRVSALMVEVARWIYMDEESGRKRESFARVRDALDDCLRRLAGLLASRGETDGWPT